MTADKSAKIDRALLVDARSAAAMLGIGQRFLWSLTASGDIPSVRLSKRAVRYSVQDLEAWIAARSSTTRGPTAHASSSSARSSESTSP